MNFERVFNTYAPSPLKGSSIDKTTDCPKCESDSFSVNVKTGVAQCFSCGVRLNHISYLTEVWSTWLEHTPEEYYEEISEARGISVETLTEAGLAYDSYRNRWLLPYKNPFSKQLKNLGTFTTSGDKAYVVYKCPNDTEQFPLVLYCPIHAIGVAMTAPPSVVVCEGEWDALAMIDLLGEGRNQTAVLAAPGASIVPAMTDKFLGIYDKVHIVYDNDSKGKEGAAKMASYVSSLGKTSLVFNWDAKTYDEGTDVRDLLTKHKDDVSDWEFFEKDCEEYDVEEDDRGELSAGYVTTLEHIPLVDTLDDYFYKYSQHFQLSRETENAIIAGLAAATTVYIGGEPNWLFIVGPAGSGKTSFLESFGGRNDYFDYSSKLSAKNLVSGWAQGPDKSFLNTLRGKTMIIKDFTTVLDMPKDQQRELFSILRDAYDGSLRVKFGNNVDRDYHNLNFNLIAGVTPAIYRHNDADMGERFLRVDFVGNHYDEQSIVDTILDSFGSTNNKKLALTDASLGFVKRIRLNPWDFNNPSDRVLLSQADKIFIGSLARYVAKLRTKPEHDRTDGLKYRPQDEVPGRLALQLSKIAYGAMKVVDPEYIKPERKRVELCPRTREVVRKVAVDTAKGFTQEIVQFIAGNEGVTIEDIGYHLRIDNSRVNRIMKDLEITNRVRFRFGASTGGRKPKKYMLANEMQSILFDIEVG